MEYFISNDPKEQEIEQILNKLKSFNLPHLETEDLRPLAVFAHDENKKLSGGITAKTHGNWLKVNYLWVDEKLRGGGVGSNLVEKVESEAINRGCKYSFVDTFDFQAVDFYLKLGYKEVFRLEEYPQTGKRHYFVKELEKTR